jgi:predicted dehydrogenase
MSTPLTLHRRQFLSAAAASLAVPMILPRSVFGANEKIVTGHIGVKNQRTSDLKAFQKLTTCAAVCDVDRDVLGKAVKLVESQGSKECDGYHDYRDLLDRKDIDAVVVTTPDH